MLATIGNISRTRPGGNSPRWPLVIAELDEEKGALRRNTVTIFDDRGPNDGPSFQLSNMANVEDPRNRHIVVTLDRSGGNPGGTYEYVMEVE